MVEVVFVYLVILLVMKMAKEASTAINASSTKENKILSLFVVNGVIK